jgi:predicted SnoaL-like aldol condensation-catalyzing enzyme
MNNKDILVRALKSLLEDYKGRNSEFMNLIAESFHMWVNGVTRDLPGLIEHFEELELTVPSRKIEFVDIVAEGDIVFSQHVVTAALGDNHFRVVDVFAKWTFKNGRITECQELTRARNDSRIS